MGAVPPGAKLFEGYHMVLQGSIHLRAQQPEGAGALRGLASLVQWSGQTVPLAGHAPVRAATQPRSQAAFNGGRALLGNFFSIQAVPSSGEQRAVEAGRGRERDASAPACCTCPASWLRGFTLPASVRPWLPRATPLARAQTGGPVRRASSTSITRWRRGSCTK